MDKVLGESVVDTGLPLSQSQSPENEAKAAFYETVQDEDAPAADEIALEAEDVSEDEAGERFAERIRQRAKESVKGYYETLPRFSYRYRDTEQFRFELNEWFDFNENDTILKDAKREFARSFKSGPKPGNHQAWKQAIADYKVEFVKKQLSMVTNSCGYVERYQALLILNYIALGTYGEVTTVTDHESQIVDNCRLLWKNNGLAILFERCKQLIDLRCPRDLSCMDDPDLNTSEVDGELMLVMNVIYAMVESLRTKPDFAVTLDKLNLIGYLMEVVSRLRWSLTAQLPIKHVLLLIWKCLLCLFGDTKMLDQVKRYMRQKFDLPTEKGDSSEVITASPLDYHAFRQDLMSRYPSYTPPPSVLPKVFDNNQSISHYIQVPRPVHAHTQNQTLPAPQAHIATPAPSPPSSPVIASGQKVRKSVFMTNQSFPFLYPTDDSVPKSIQEAGELFASRIKTTPAMLQLWQERDHFMKQERGWVAGSGAESTNATANGQHTPCKEQKILDRIESFYRANHPGFNSFVNVLLKVLLNSISFMNNEDTNQEARSKETNLKAITAILYLLTRWLRVSHVLKFEYLSAILIDSRYYLLVYRFLYSHDVLSRALYIPDEPGYSFFARCRELSDCASSTFYGQTGIEEEGPTVAPNEAMYEDSIDHYSSRYLFTLVNMIRVLRKIIKNKTQRIIIVAELPSETLKKALTIYQKDLWTSVLDIFKEQVPYNGRKWKYNNMDLVSAIYLTCKAKLRDDWLAGADVSAEVDDACVQEVALRALTQFYNDRSYGQESDQGDFFAHELESLSLNSSNP